MLDTNDSQCYLFLRRGNISYNTCFRAMRQGTILRSRHEVITNVRVLIFITVSTCKSGQSPPNSRTLAQCVKKASWFSNTA